MHDDILKIALEMTDATKRKMSDLDQIMMHTKILTMNARLEAARAGDVGKSFAVVAQEMGLVANQVNDLSASLHTLIAENAARIRSAGEEMALEFRGSRYADLARSGVEIMDRNLYERSCDVRWWATDSAVVDALLTPSPENCAHATSRLATILRSYTVYLDLWIADRSGRIVASGRPDRYPDVRRLDVSNENWFKKGMATADGDSFAVCDVDTCAALGGAQVATYSTAIRPPDQTNGRSLGVLGIFFDWAPQAEAIVSGISLGQDEPESTTVMLLDSKFRIIASTRPQTLGRTYPLRPTAEAGHYREGSKVVGYGLTPGYETYRGLGWYGCIESDCHRA